MACTWRTMETCHVCASDQSLTRLVPAPALPMPLLQITATGPSTLLSRSRRCSRSKTCFESLRMRLIQFGLMVSRRHRFIRSCSRGQRTTGRRRLASFGSRRPTCASGRSRGAYARLNDCTPHICMLCIPLSHTDLEVSSVELLEPLITNKSNPVWIAWVDG